MDRLTLKFLCNATEAQREQWDRLQNLLGSMPDVSYCPKHGQQTRLDRLRSYRTLRESGAITGPYHCAVCAKEGAT